MILTLYQNIYTLRRKTHDVYFTVLHLEVYSVYQRKLYCDHLLDNRSRKLKVIWEIYFRMNKINIVSKPGYYSLRNRLRRLEVTQRGAFKPMHMYDADDINTLLSKVKETTDVDAFKGFINYTESQHSQVRKMQMNRISPTRKEQLTEKYTAVSVVNAETTNSYYSAVRCTIVNWSDTNGTLLYGRWIISYFRTSQN